MDEPEAMAGSARHIVVGVDGSEGASRAVALAVRLAVDLVAEVIVVHGTLSSPEGRPTEEQLARWCRPLSEAGVATRTVVEADDAVRLLHRVGEIEDAYAIVVGSSGRSELREFVIGGVAIELAHHGNRPLMIAPTAVAEIAW
ncbi:MAG: universal stress protein [Actinomycetota bacterium]|nr:universal stress protein [Actinomycetota bacterium]